MPERRIDKHIVPPKALILAPMAGITDPPYRLLAREKGADLAYTEMVSAKGLLVRGNKGSSRILEVYPHEGPLMGQLYGSDPAVLAEAAFLVQELGFDGVDINAGCPVRKVVKKGGGAALLREPTRLQAILKRVRDALSIEQINSTLPRQGLPDARVRSECRRWTLGLELGCTGYAVLPIRFSIRSTRKVSHGDGFLLSAKDHPFQARYIVLAV